jgi:hypothetical protein
VGTTVGLGVTVGEDGVLGLTVGVGEDTALGRAVRVGATLGVLVGEAAGASSRSNTRRR